ncbi:hypothetical protein CU048_09455 [Beijerinckiaceae bacterium]|nr:hypothetical protein CU048_09455 [Beijerinckiaceae bacterium]
MRPPHLSTFPLHKPFERQDPTTSLSEVALRLVVNCYSNEPRVVGTAAVLCGHLLVTANHIIIDAFGAPPNPDGSIVNVDKHLVAAQVLPGPEYIFWDVHSIIADCSSDIALLNLGNNPCRSNPNDVPRWRQLPVNPFSPEVGERVAAFGYRLSSVQVSKNEDGGNHIAVDDEPMVSIGEVREVFEMRRDSNLPFPCYQVSARFDGGMSGGPVFDETGCICGIVCSSIEGSHLDGEPISYVSTLWPLFRLMTSIGRGDNYPRDVSYPIIELARGGQISVPDLPKLEQWFAKHVR